jgi:hypothetical protein
MSTPLLPPFIFAWLVTVLIEAPIVAAFYPRRRLRMALVAAIATSATNLAMNLFLPRWVGVGTAFLVLGEGGALLTEAAVYTLMGHPIDHPRALAAAGLANASSFAVGFVLPTTI